MSRRESKDDKKAKRQKSKSDRKVNIRTELQRVIIACEGSVTEKNYFESIFNELIQNRDIAKSSLVIAKHSHTDPKGVLQDLLNALEKDSEFEYKWIVIDRDKMRVNGGGHSVENFNGAISSASSHKIDVAYSNPSFEIWYLLHFEYRNTPLDRDEVIKELDKYVDYKKNSQTIYAEILENQKIAIINAKRLIEMHTSDSKKLSPAEDNPSTTVYKLVELLNDLIKDKFKIIISGVAAYPLNKTYVGKIIERPFIEHLQELQLKYKINPAGEGGEFESLVINCPLFKKELKLKYDVVGEGNAWRMKL